MISIDPFCMAHLPCTQKLCNRSSVTLICLNDACLMISERQWSSLESAKEEIIKEIEGKFGFTFHYHSETKHADQKSLRYTIALYVYTVTDNNQCGGCNRQLWDT